MDTKRFHHKSKRTDIEEYTETFCEMSNLFDHRPTEENLNRYEREDQVALNERSFPKVPEFL